MIERHITKDKGDLAVAKTIADLRQSAIYACLPISEHLPFDLIAVMPDMTTLRRVQVKYRGDMGVGAVNIRFRSNYYNSKKIYNRPVNLKEIDCYAIYCAPTDQIVYLRIDELPVGVKSVTLRFNPPRNGQKKDVWLIRDYVDPSRIGNGNEPCTLTRRILSDEDELARCMVIAYLMEKGIQVMLPQSQCVPFDLVAVMPDMKTLRRMAVTSGTLCSSPYVDDYAVYNPAEGEVRYFTADQATGGVKPITRECLKSRVYKIDKVSGIVWELLAIELTTVPGVNKQMNGASQGFEAAREAA